jgi:hypothetical protein
VNHASKSAAARRSHLQRRLMMVVANANQLALNLTVLTVIKSAIQVLESKAFWIGQLDVVI